MPTWGYYDNVHTSLFDRCCPCGKAPRFWSINWAAALLHLINAIATLYLWSIDDNQDQVFRLTETANSWFPVDKMANVTMTNTTGYRCNNATKNGLEMAFPINDEWCVGRQTATTSELSLWWLVIVFHFLSFAFQAVAMMEWKFTLCGTPWVRNYIEEVDSGTNSLRMIEYSISATLMQIAIALVLGIGDRLVIAGVAALTVVTMLLGLIAEQLKYDRKNMAWTAHFTGWFSMLAVWGILGRKFVYTIQTSDASPPEFVYVIVLVIAFLYSLFGGIQFYQLWKSDVAPNMDKKTSETIRIIKLNQYVEMIYCVNSLVSKTFLGWMIFANALGGMAES
mgnify:FL=1